MTEIDTDAGKLRTLAEWFDVRDDERNSSQREVQEDLRRIADILEALPAPADDMVERVKHTICMEVQGEEFGRWVTHFCERVFSSTNAQIDALDAACEKAARAVLAIMPPVPEGWKLVPVEPVEVMIDAAYPANSSGPLARKGAVAMYQDMVAAAPAPEEK